MQRTKLKKTVYSGSGSADYVQDYVKGFVYKTDFTDALPQLSFFSHSEGRVVKTGSNYEYQYFMKDHLGSVRVVFRGINGEILERNHYYPFACPPFGVGATVILQVTMKKTNLGIILKELKTRIDDFVLYSKLYYFHIFIC